MREETNRLLALERYCRHLRLDPLHFFGGASQVRAQRGCDDVWPEHDWQAGGKVSRNQARQKIAEAELDVAQVVGYWPAPVWISGERKEYPRPYRPELVGTSGRNVAGRWKTLHADWGKVLYGGERKATLIEGGVDATTTLDADGDGYDEWTVLTVAAALPDGFDDACEVECYFKDYDPADAANCRTDPSDDGASPAWRIEPVQASLSAGVLTVRVHRWLLLKPQLQEGMDMGTESINADLPGSYVDELDVYWTRNDPSRQATFLWGEDVVCSDVAACAWATQAGCIRTKDGTSGLLAVRPATWNAVTKTFTASSCFSQSVEPDAVTLYYRAGLVPTRYGASTCYGLTNWWAETIAILATARLELPICSCGNAQYVVDRWREELSLMNEKRMFRYSEKDLDNPLGTRAGEVYVWKRLTRGRGTVRAEAITV